MVAEYATTSYFPSAERWGRLTADGLARAKKLAAWRVTMRRGWPGVKVSNVTAEGPEPMHVGGTLRLRATVQLGGLKPEDVLVQLFHGAVDNQGDIPSPATAEMTPERQEGAAWLYSGAVTCKSSGQQGYAVRVLPRHVDLPHSHEPGLIAWG
jgi:starch phosphorylase